GGDTTVALLLLENGADVNAKGAVTRCGEQFETTALHLAAEESKAMVQLLLEKGADVNAKGTLSEGDEHSDVTALHIATGSKKKRIVRLLLENGADINAKMIERG